MMKTKLTSQLSYSVLKRSTRLLSVGTTADQDEMNFYSKLSSDWWSDNGVMKPLHSLNVLRVPFIRDGLICTDKRALLQQDSSKPLSGLNILEVGCGGGILTEPLARLGACMTGIDVTENMIECARLHASSDPSVSHIEYIHSTIEEHARTRQDHYDAVVASEVLEHVTEKNMFVDSCSSVLKVKTYQGFILKMEDEGGVIGSQDVSLEAFVEILQDYPAVFFKSMTPDARKEKSARLQDIIHRYQTSFGKDITKINNMKTSVKKKTDVKATGEEKKNLNKWKEILLKILGCADLNQHLIKFQPGGSLFVTTLNRTLATYIAGICIAEYVLRLLPVGTHQYDKCITPSEVKVLFKKCGLSTLLTHGFFYNFVTNTWHWCNSQAVCFAAHAVKN